MLRDHYVLSVDDINLENDTLNFQEAMSLPDAKE